MNFDCRIPSEGTAQLEFARNSGDTDFVEGRFDATIHYDVIDGKPRFRSAATPIEFVVVLADQPISLYGTADRRAMLDRWLKVSANLELLAAAIEVDFTQPLGGPVTPGYEWPLIDGRGVDVS